MKQKDYINEIELNKIINNLESPAISLYMPTYKKTDATKQNEIRYKNLLSKIEKILNKNEKSGKILNQASKLLNNFPFWQKQEKSFCLFSSPQYFNYFKLPFEFDEKVILSKEFYIKPLLKNLSNEDESHFVLLIDKSEVKLYKCNTYQISEVSLGLKFKNFYDYIKYNEYEESIQEHLVGRQGKNKNFVTFHGQGESEDKSNIKEELKNFLKHVDKHIQKQLSERSYPLLVCATNEMFGEYKNITHYKNLMEKHISVDFSNYNIEEIHSYLKKIIKEKSNEIMENSISSYIRLRQVKREMTCEDINKLIDNSKFGKVETLFIDETADIHDVNKDISQNMHKEKNEHFEKTNHCAINTISNKGKVFIVPSQKMPDNAKICAILRYP